MSAAAIPTVRASRRTLSRRKLVSNAMIGLTYAAAVIATLPLILILAHLLRLGATSVNWTFFTHMPVPAGESGGGMANAIAGTGMIVIMALLPSRSSSAAISAGRRRLTRRAVGAAFVGGD